MDWKSVLALVSVIVNGAEPVINAIVGVAAPEASTAISIAEKLLQGAVNEAPDAITLITQIKNGTPLSLSQVQQYEVSYEADYQQTKADITAALAALPA